MHATDRHLAHGVVGPPDGYAEVVDNAVAGRPEEIPHDVERYCDGLALWRDMDTS